MPNSCPRRASVNDGIEKELCSLKYVLVEGHEGGVSTGPGDPAGKI